MLWLGVSKYYSIQPHIYMLFCRFFSLSVNKHFLFETQVIYFCTIPWASKCAWACMCVFHFDVNHVSRCNPCSLRWRLKCTAVSHLPDWDLTSKQMKRRDAELRKRQTTTKNRCTHLHVIKKDGYKTSKNPPEISQICEFRETLLFVKTVLLYQRFIVH